ncbi:hypothetical protein Ocin01_16178 [Orchesella cincta]|uniref:Uncharacterized protein n=1 Tax=Orchesella cincta TaxID=48709 RepID=A0A1D2MBY1_ORCCI|nr:hypothetical protein Ocin01_16178 [Orchesella cincta]
MSDLGVNYPCREYTCPICNKRWESAVAWRDSVNSANPAMNPCLQRDSSVSTSTTVNPVCHPQTGKRGGGSTSIVREETPAKAVEGWRKPTKSGKLKWEHRRDLCEKCKRLGRYCKSVPVKPTPAPKVEAWKSPQRTTPAPARRSPPPSNPCGVQVGWLQIMIT